MLGNLIIAGGAGLASTLFLNWPPLWWLGLASFAPLFWLLDRPAGRWQTFSLGLTFGLGLMGLNLAWFLETLPLGWLNIQSPWLAWLAVVLAWLLFTASAAAFLGLFALAWREFKRGDWRDLILAPALWIIAEYGRAWATTIVFAGPGTILGPHWTNGFAGYLLAESPRLALLASVGGIYLLSFVVIFANYSIYRLFVSSNRERRRLVIPVLILTAWLTLWPINSTNSISPDNQADSTLQLAVANTYSASSFASSPSTTKLDALDRQLNRQLAGQLFDILALPEDSRLIAKLATTSTDLIFPALNQLTNRRNILVIDSIRSEDAGRIKSKILYLNPATEEINFTEKRLLATYGEYLPYFARGLVRLAGQGEWLTNYDKKRGVTAGPAFAPISWQGERISVLECSEIFSPALYRAQTAAGATILGTISSQSLFHGSRWFYRQSLSAARVRAAENGRALFQATDDAPSFILNSQGQTIAESNWQEPGVIFATAGTRTKLTPYTRLGDWPVILALFFLIFLLTATDAGTRPQTERGK
jgi:apolipoprotein N-acyltransferase